MKILFKLLAICTFAIMASCEVDDYSDANPPGLKDGPEIYVYNPASGVVTSTRSDNSVITYVTKGQNATFNVEVIDAPGIIDSVSAYLSDTVGLVGVSGFDAVKGSETGSFSMIYTPEPNDPAITFDDNIVNMSVTVSDAQVTKGKKTPKTTQPTVRRVKAIACVPTIDLSGFWMATSSGTSGTAWTDGTVAGGGSFTGLKKLVRLQIRTSGGAAPAGANASTENGGVLFIDDASFGLWTKQGITNTIDFPTGRFTVCGSTLTGYQAIASNGSSLDASRQGNPVYTGTVNTDGSITINYSNTGGLRGGNSTTITLVRPAPF